MDKKGHKVSFYLQEIKKWQTTVKLLQLENGAFKDHLSETISQNSGLCLIYKADYIQQRFFEKDQIMDILQPDFNRLKDIISLEGITDVYEKKFLLLERDMEKFIFEFHRMKIFFFKSLC
jgi:hypothetical protein